ncbi:MAG: ComF family protein [Candidatus Saccharicenans sp.]|nr:ComF family protein [Candidatus Saccharicenans sp.]MDI6850004.1 ComF family protein [Candidatus Saccharicenans sp.]
MKLRFRLSRAFHPVTVTVFPSFCRLCGRALDDPDEKIICARCLETVEIHRGPVCPVCGRFYQQAAASGQPCGQCLERAPEFSRHRSLGPYSGRLKEVILLFKYRSYEILSRPLSAMAFRHFAGGDLFEGLDYIVPVPLHRKREKQRGFNQAELLGRGLSDLSGLPLLSGVLVKIRNTPPQVSLEAAERETNLRKAFMVKKAGKIAGRRVLLVDDVFTTGSTLRECAARLRAAGAIEIRALTLARAA